MSDVINKQLELLTDSYLLANTEEERAIAKSKIDVLTNVIASLGNATTPSSKTKKVANKMSVSNHKLKKTYEIEIALNVNDKVEFLYTEYRNNKPYKEHRALGIYKGIVNVEMNNYSYKAVGIESTGDYGDLLQGKIYGFKLASMKEFKKA